MNGGIGLDFDKIFYASVTDLEKTEVQPNFFIKIISDKTNLTIMFEDSFMTNMYAVGRFEVTIQFDDPWTRMTYKEKISDMMFEVPWPTIQESIQQHWCDHTTDHDLHEPKDSLLMNSNDAWPGNDFLQEYWQSNHNQTDETYHNMMEDTHTHRRLPEMILNPSETLDKIMYVSIPNPGKIETQTNSIIKIILELSQLAVPTIVSEFSHNFETSLIQEFKSKKIVTL